MEYLIGFDSEGRIEGFFILDYDGARRPSGKFVKVTEQEYNRVYGARYTHYVDGEFITLHPEISVEQLEVGARNQRNALLRASDWTQLPDIPESTKTVWATYRQALRDVPQQSGFPSDITWPVAPA